MHWLFRWMLSRRVGFLSGIGFTFMFKEFSTMATPTFTAVQKGQAFSSEFRMFYRNAEGKLVSPWHDIPLHASSDGKTFHMVVEIPRWTNAKMEIGTTDPLAPIKQDTKKGVLRFVDNVFPHKGYIWNYGAIPQTWEDPELVNPETGAKGDNDPIDVCEIGSRVADRGDVIPVKVLGVLAMIDEGETDWKVIAIDTRDPLAAQLHDIDDVQRLMPGLTAATVEWFQFYKVPAGKPENEFAFNKEFKNKAYAEEIVAETHASWAQLMSGEKKSSLSQTHTSLGPSKGVEISGDDAEAEAAKFPDAAKDAPVPAAVDNVHFVAASGSSSTQGHE